VKRGLQHRSSLSQVERAFSIWQRNKSIGLRVETCGNNLNFHLSSLSFLFLKNRRCGVGSLRSGGVTK
jgi:hypothetical protein